MCLCQIQLPSSSFSRGTSNSCGAFLTVSHCARLAERTYNVWTNRLDKNFKRMEPSSKSPPNLDILECELDLRADQVHGASELSEILHTALFPVVEGWVYVVLIEEPLSMVLGARPVSLVARAGSKK